MTETKQQTVSSKGSGRIAFFDGFKGFSILSIIIYYFFQHLFPGGYLAVNIFLLIAGYFNFRHFYQKIARGRPLGVRTYLKKRFNRLFFPMLAMIVTVGTYILVFARDYWFNLRNMAISSLFFLNNYFQIYNQQSYFVEAANPSPFVHLWYVSLYGQLILLTPLLVLLFYKWHQKAAWAANMLVITTLVSAVLMAYWSFGAQDPTNVYYNLLTRLFAYTAGGTLAFLLPVHINPQALQAKVKGVFNGLASGALVILLIMMLFMYGTQAFAYRFGMFLFTLVVAIFVIASMHPQTLWHKLMANPVFSFFGRRSYSYYLWFYPVYLLAPNQLFGLKANIWIYFLYKFLLIMALAELSYRLFEEKVWSLPIGQDFNWKKCRHQINYLRHHPKELTHIQITSLLYLIFLILGGISILTASEERQSTASELQEKIEKNQELAADTQTEETREIKVINNIEGLGQQELLYANALNISFIGDSLLLTSLEEIQEVFPKAIIDGEVGRQLYQSNDVVNRLKDRDLLADTVVTILGANGTFTPGQLNDYVEAVGVGKTHYFLSVGVDRPWVADANYQLKQVAERYDNVYIIDWAAHLYGHSEWLASDETHLNPEGSKEMAKFIAQEIYRMR